MISSGRGISIEMQHILSNRTQIKHSMPVLSNISHFTRTKVSLIVTFKHGIIFVFDHILELYFLSRTQETTSAHACAVLRRTANYLRSRCDCYCNFLIAANGFFGISIYNCSHGTIMTTIHVINSMIIIVQEQIPARRILWSKIPECPH